MESGHLLTLYGLTRPEVSLMVSSGSFCLVVCIFFIMLGYLLRDK
jgi:hypothetical protein